MPPRENEKKLPSFTEPQTINDFAQISVGTGYKKTYFVHKELIHYCSPFMSRELNRSNRNLIYMDRGIESHVFGLVIHWMYTRCIDVLTNPSLKTIASLCGLAKCFEMTDLAIEALNAFRKSLSGELPKEVDKELLDLVKYIYTMKNGEAVKAILIIEVVDKIVTGAISEKDWLTQKLPMAMVKDVVGALKVIDDEKKRFMAMNPLNQEVYAKFMKMKYSKRDEK